MGVGPIPASKIDALAERKGLDKQSADIFRAVIHYLDGVYMEDLKNQNDRTMRRERGPQPPRTGAWTGKTKERR